VEGCVTRDQLSLILDRFEQWIVETVDYATDDHPYRTSYAKDNARKDLFEALCDGMEVPE
jgi:hypothetical protein